MISIGLQELAAAPPAWLKGQRLGLLCNQASTDGCYRHSREVVNQCLPGQLTCKNCSATDSPASFRPSTGFSPTSRTT